MFFIGLFERCRELGKSINVVEMGMGSGVNGVAALLANESARYIGIEKDNKCIQFAKEVFRWHGIEERVEIYHGDFLDFKFLRSCMNGRYADVVVNENIGDPLFLKEPQLETALAISPYTHQDTLFVPAGADIYIDMPSRYSKPIYFGRVDFGRNILPQIYLRHSFKEGEIPSGSFAFTCIADLVNYNGMPININGVGRYIIRMLPLSELVPLHFNELDINKQYCMVISFSGFPKNTYKEPKGRFRIIEV